MGVVIKRGVAKQILTYNGGSQIKGAWPNKRRVDPTPKGAWPKRDGRVLTRSRPLFAAANPEAPPGDVGPGDLWPPALPQHLGGHRAAGEGAGPESGGSNKNLGVFNKNLGFLIKILGFLVKFWGFFTKIWDFSHKFWGCWVKFWGFSPKFWVF